MSDSYQAIYDAVRSRIGSVDVASAVESALQNAFGSAYHHLEIVAQEFSITAEEARRPSVLMRPDIRRDGNQWCALYGADLQCGVAGFGDSPELAMQDFDKNWRTKL